MNNHSKNVSITNQNAKKEMNSAQNNNFEASSQIKLSARSSSRTSSPSISHSNSLFPNLTPQATHIAGSSQMNNFNRPVSSGQVVNILTRKASDLEKKILLPNSDKTNRLNSPLSNSDPNFSGSNYSNEKNFLSSQILQLKNQINSGQASKERPKSGKEINKISNLTINNLNRFDNLNETIKTCVDTLSPIPSYSSKSSSPNDSSSPDLTAKTINFESNNLTENSNESTQNKSPQTFKSVSTASQLYEGLGTKSAGLLSNSSAGRTKKKVSFNDNLLKVHLIPNLTNFLTVEKCKSFDKGDGMVSIDEQMYGTYFEDEPDSPLIQTNFDFTESCEHQINESQDSSAKVKLAKTHLKQIQSDQTIYNDLRRNIRNHNLNNHLQVVKLTVHPNKNQSSDTKTQNFLTLVGSNNFSQKPASKRENSASNRSIHSQLFSQQRSQTFHYDDTESIDDIKTGSYAINVLKGHKYSSKNAKNIKNDFSRNSLGSSNSDSKFKRMDYSKENNLNLIKNSTKFVFLKQDDNMVREPSFIKPQIEKNLFNNNSSSSFASESNLKTGVDLKNVSMAKNVPLNSVNQLIALKDVNYFLNNNVKSNLKSIKSSYPNDLSKIKLKSNGHLANISNLDLDFRRTNSAFPLLRNNNANGSVGKQSESAKFSNNTGNFSSLPLSNSLNRAKTFLFNQNFTSNNHIDKKIKGTPIEKTTF